MMFEVLTVVAGATVEFWWEQCAAATESVPLSELSASGASLLFLAAGGEVWTSSVVLLEDI